MNVITKFGFTVYVDIVENNVNNYYRVSSYEYNLSERFVVYSGRFLSQQKLWMSVNHTNKPVANVYAFILINKMHTTKNKTVVNV